MNSHYLFLTIHGHGVIIKNLEKTLKDKYPYWGIKISDKEFENVR